jgi:hypothetical protein
VSDYSLGREFIRKNRMDIIFEVIEECDDLAKLYLLLGEEMRFRSQEAIDEEYKNTIDEEMPTSKGLKSFVQEVMRGFLEESKNLDKEDKEQRRKFIERVLYFGNNFIKFLQNKIKEIIQENLDKKKSIFTEREKRVQDELKSVGNAIEDEEIDKDTYSKIIEMFRNDTIRQHLEKNKHKSSFSSSEKNELKNKLMDFTEFDYFKDELPLQIEVSVAQDLQEEYLNFDFYQVSCPGCMMPSTVKSTDTTGTQNYLFHLPPLFRGNIFRNLYSDSLEHSIFEELYRL